MAHQFSLAFLTVGNISPVEAVHIAARQGYQSVGLRMLPAAPSEPAYPLLTDDTVLRETQKALAETGITVGDVEIVRLKEHTNINDFEPFIMRAAALGAKHVLVAADDFERQRLTENFGLFCQLAAQASLTADLEFMPWTAIKSIAEAREVVEGAGQGNGGILIDALHFDRSSSSLADIRALPPAMLHYVQLCDGPVPYGHSDAELIAIARGARLMPGHGGIDLVAFMDAIPDGTPVSLEVANLDIQTDAGAEACAHQSIAAAKEILVKAGRKSL